MYIYIARLGSNQILGCYSSLVKAKARVDKEFKALVTKKGPFTEITVRTTGFQGKYYCLVGRREFKDTSSQLLYYRHYIVWVQKHYLHISPLELLAEQL